jgi:hypothetical protein
MSLNGLGLTQLACWDFSTAVLPFFSFAVFALVERKNGKRMIKTYHAAAGETCGIEMPNNASALLLCLCSGLRGQLLPSSASLGEPHGKRQSGAFLCIVGRL